MRLLAGVLVGQAARHVVLDGDDSLRGRPMTRIARPAARDGRRGVHRPRRHAAVVVSGGAPLRGIEHRLEVASAQVKSCLLLAGLFAEGTPGSRAVALPRPHREDARGRGRPVLREGGAVGWRARSRASRSPTSSCPATSPRPPPCCRRGRAPGRPRGAPPGDAPTRGRTGLVAVMRRMGVDVREEPGEPPSRASRAGRSSCSRRRPPARHRGRAGGGPSMIDELPLVGLLGAMASGTTMVRGAGELRVKESDRIASVVARPAGDGRRRRGARGRLRGDRRGPLRGRESSRWATTASRCWARWRASSARRGSRSRLRGRRRLLPRLRPATSPRSGRCPRDRGHRRPGGRRQEHGRPGRRAASRRRLPRSGASTGLTWLALERDGARGR